MNKLKVSWVLRLAVVDATFISAGDVKVQPKWCNEGRGDQGEVPGWTAISEGRVKRQDTIGIYLRRKKSNLVTVQSTICSADIPGLYRNLGDPHNIIV